MKQYPVAILAGGLAKRLRPVTATIPKSLVPVAGEPFLAHQLRLLRTQGIESAVLCVGHLGEMIEEEFGDGAAWDIELKYSYDGPDLLGTGGALVNALPLLGNAFYVLYGDSYLPIDLAGVARRFRKEGKLGAMTVFRNDDAFDRSNVHYHNGQLLRYDKEERTPEMRHIDYGLSLFWSEAFASKVRAEAFDLGELQRELVDAHQMSGCLVTERFYEIGSHKGLADLESLLASDALIAAN